MTKGEKKKKITHAMMSLSKGQSLGQSQKRLRKVISTDRNGFLLEMIVEGIQPSQLTWRELSVLSHTFLILLDIYI